MQVKIDYCLLSGKSYVAGRIPQGQSHQTSARFFLFFLAENTWGKLKFATRLTRRRPSLIINYALRHSGRQAGWQVDSLPVPSGCQTFTGLAADRGCSIAGATPTPPRADIWYSYVCNEMSSACCSCKCNRCFCCCCCGINHSKRSEGTCCCHMFNRCRQQLSSVWFMHASNMSCKSLLFANVAAAAATYLSVN